MITLAIVLVSITIYIATGGFVSGAIYRRFYDDTAYDNLGPGLAAIFGGMFWPIALPLLSGLWLAYSPDRKRERKEAEQRKIRELERWHEDWQRKQP